MPEIVFDILMKLWCSENVFHEYKYIVFINAMPDKR